MRTGEEAMTRAKSPSFKSLALAVCALLALVLVEGAAAAEPRAPDRQLTVMSYNVHTGIGADGKLDLGRTADAIRASGAEVIGLQEVDRHWSARSDFEDQARLLADELGMHYFFAPIYSLDPPGAGRPRREFGLAVLSEYPIIDAENHEIARLSTQTSPPRLAPAPGFPEVVVNVRGVPLHFYATHLDYRSDPGVRRIQVDDMLAIMAEDDGPKVLVGDLNAPPDAPELARLWEPLRDAWEAAPAGDAGYTFPTNGPVKRIDYVLVSPDVEVEETRVLDTLASDHLPVVSELLLPGDRVGVGR